MRKAYKTDQNLNKKFMKDLLETTKNLELTQFEIESIRIALKMRSLDCVNDSNYDAAKFYRELAKKIK